MPIISLEIMKIIDERETQKKQQQQQQQRQKRKRETKAVVKGWKINDFVVRLS